MVQTRPRDADSPMEFRALPMTGAYSIGACTCREGFYLEGGFANDSQALSESEDLSSRCRACPAGADCHGATLPPIAKRGYGQLATAGANRTPLFFPCKLKEICITNPTNDNGCDCLGGELGETRTLVVRCGTGHDVDSALCSLCITEDNYADNAGSCELCYWGNAFVYALVALTVTFAWFPMIRFLTDTFESLEITINFVQMIGCALC